MLVFKDRAGEEAERTRHPGKGHLKPRTERSKEALLLGNTEKKNPQALVRGQEPAAVPSQSDGVMGKP